MINAPWPAMALVGAILGAYAAQSLVGGGPDAAFRGGFAPSDLLNGRFWTLPLSLFVSDGWGHAGANALGAFIFGPPVARLCGTHLKGALAFFAFVLACGVLAALGWAAAHWGDNAVAVGSSGMVFGLMGAASRLYGRESGLSPILSAMPLGLGLGMVVVNLLMAIVAPPGGGDRIIAWEAHAAGFVAGLLLVGALARVLGRTGAREGGRER